MSDMNLKVTPAELEAKAADFKSVMTQTKSLTDDMMNDVTGLSSSWTGDASASYINKFRKLQTDMDTMGRMINEHVNNLTELAKEYTTTEKKNAAATESLAANIISQERSAISDSYQRWHFEIEEVIMIEFKKYLPIGSVVLLKNEIGRAHV